MSVRIYSNLFCDDCGNWEHTGSRGARIARRVWATKGWVRRRVDGRIMDLCPYCATKGQKPMNGAPDA